MSVEQRSDTARDIQQSWRSGKSEQHWRPWRSRRRGYSAEHEPRAWLLLLPALVLIALFNVYPLIRAFLMAFQSGTMRRLHYTGLNNFRIVLADPEFHQAMINTSVFALIVVPAGIAVSMLIAILVHNEIKGRHAFETIFFIPYMTSVIAIGIVFRYLFNGDYGLLNYLLGLIHVGPIDFLNNPRYNMLTLIIFGIWFSLAFNIIILLSGLRSIDTDYYRVADMFGATQWEQFVRITLPQMLPILTFLFVVDFIGAFKVYSEVFALFNGQAGVADSAVTAVFYIFNKFYVENKYGQAMCAAVLLFLLILVFTLIQNRVLRAISRRT